MLLTARRYQARASAAPGRSGGSSRGTQVGFPPPGDDSVWGLPFSTSLLFFAEHWHNPLLCPLKLVAGFPLISVAGEAKYFQYFPPPLPSQQTTFILPSTRLFQGSMGRQDDELVPAVTVALSITTDIPGGHMSPKDSSRLGNSTKRLKLSFAMKPPQSPRPAAQAGPSQTCKDPSEPTGTPALALRTRSRVQACTEPTAALGGSPSPFSPTDFLTESHWDKHF